MAYDTVLAEKVRNYLSKMPSPVITEKKMFGGLAFLINGKMCVNVSGKNLMCRFDPTLTDALSKKTGYLPMIMRGKKMDGYCYVEPIGFKTEKDFTFWMNTCLAFNDKAKSSKK